MNKSYMYNYIDILNESLGDGYCYYITDNLPIFNIDGLIESYQYDIGNILTESKGDKGKNLIDRIRQIGKKILSFLSGILEKIMGFFKKLRNFIRGKIEQLKNNKKGDKNDNKNGDEKIIDGKEYSRRKRDEKNKNDNDDDVDEEKLNVVKSKEDIEEERRQEEEKKRQEEEKKRQEEEKKKRKEEENRKKREEIDKEIEKYNSVEVYKDMDYNGGISAANKILDLFKDGFKDFVMRIEEFNNIDSILHSMGIKFQDGNVDRLNDKKDIERIDEVLNKFNKLIRISDANIYTNGKINSESEIKEEVDKIKNIFYGSGEKVKVIDFKGVVVDNPYKQLKSVDDRIEKIGNLAKTVCNNAINNAKSFMKQLEDLAKRINETGENNSSLSGIIYAFANKYMQIVNKISTALRSQSSILNSITVTATDAALDISDINTALTDIDIAKHTRSLYESYNDYDGMNWLRDILFE